MVHLINNKLFSILKFRTTMSQAPIQYYLGNYYIFGGKQNSALSGKIMKLDMQKETWTEVKYSSLHKTN